MVVSQEFKKQCAKLIYDWYYIGFKWNSNTWSGIFERGKKYFSETLNDEFFKSFANRSLEEKRYMFQQIQTAYISSSLPSSVGVVGMDYTDYSTLSYCENSFRTGGNNDYGYFGISFFDLKNQFLKMYDIVSDLDKFADTETKLKSWTDAFPNKKPSEINQQITDLNNLSKEWDNTFGTEYGKPITPELLKKAGSDLKEWKTSVETWKTSAKTWQDAVKNRDEELKKRDETINTLTNNQKPADYDQIKKDLGIANDTMSKLIPIREYWDNNFKKEFGDKIDVADLTKVKEKLKDYDINRNNLLETNRQQVIRLTKSFYLNDLGLDEKDDLQPTYGDYLVLVNRYINAREKPQDLINAFKITALARATYKAQAISDKYKNSKSKIVRANKFKFIENVKTFWELNYQVEVNTHEMNPLLTPEVDDRDKFKQQIKDIVKSWQEK